MIPRDMVAIVRDEEHAAGVGDCCHQCLSLDTFGVRRMKGDHVIYQCFH